MHAQLDGFERLGSSVGARHGNLRQIGPGQSGLAHGQIAAWQGLRLTGTSARGLCAGQLRLATVHRSGALRSAARLHHHHHVAGAGVLHCLVQQASLAQNVFVGWVAHLQGRVDHAG